jgi:hypothetical protein
MVTLLAIVRCGKSQRDSAAVGIRWCLKHGRTSPEVLFDRPVMAVLRDSIAGLIDSNPRVFRVVVARTKK